VHENSSSAPPGLHHLPLTPTACAVGCILSPLRGCKSRLAFHRESETPVLTHTLKPAFFKALIGTANRFVKHALVMPWFRAGKPSQGYRCMSDLRSQISSLSAAEKAELLDTVWESLEADALSLTDAQRAELDHRIARHEQNPSDVIPWQQVRAGLFKKP
jgi:putative addiction module component (TIGR02574 family)